MFYLYCVHAKSNTLEQQLQTELEGPQICQLLN